MVAFHSQSAREIACFHQQIITDFARRKTTTSRDDLLPVSIPLTNKRGFLVPVGECHADDPTVVRLLTEFRKPITTFPAIFEVTEERTRSWLRTHLLDVPDRILFFVVDCNGRIIGHAGFARCLNSDRTMELDNIIRGIPDVEPGLMSSAVSHLVHWAKTTFRPMDLVLKVMQNNPQAIRFYERLGFVITASQPLRRVELPNEIRLEPFEPTDDEQPVGHYLTMTYQPQTASINPPHIELFR